MFRDRDPYILTIPLCLKVNRQWMERDLVEVEVYPTFSDYLVAHPSIDKYQHGWTITHLPSKSMIATGLESLGAAMMVAGAIAFLIDWSEHHRSVIRASVAGLPEDLRTWLTKMSPTRPVLE